MKTCTRPGCHAAGQPQPDSEFRRPKRHTCRTCVNVRAAELERQRRASPYAVDREHVGRVSITPFRGWLWDRMLEIRVTYDDPSAVMAARLGVAERTLARWLNDPTVRQVSVDMADRAFVRWGNPALLRDLYPELYAFPDTALHVVAA